MRCEYHTHTDTLLCWRVDEAGLGLGLRGRGRRRGGTGKRRDAWYFLRRGRLFGISDHVHNKGTQGFLYGRGRYFTEQIYSLFLTDQRQLMPHLRFRRRLVLLPAYLLYQLLHRLRQHPTLRHHFQTSNFIFACATAYCLLLTAGEASRDYDFNFYSMDTVRASVDGYCVLFFNQRNPFTHTHTQRLSSGHIYINIYICRLNCRGLVWYWWWCTGFFYFVLLWSCGNISPCPHPIFLFLLREFITTLRSHHSKSEKSKRF